MPRSMVLAASCLVLGAAAPALAHCDTGATVDHASASRASDWTVKFVGGDESAAVIRRGESFFSGTSAVTTPLPEGYPRPTAPGAIELKKYPSVRRAEVSGEGASRGPSSSRGFWPLFQHIQRNNIAMTAPVEMDLPGWSATERSLPESWTMSFLYRERELRETGTEGNVVIRDTEPVTVVSMGLRGAYSNAAFNGALERIETWLGEQDRWEAAGAPRWLGYNGPEMPNQRKWAEVQIPIRLVEDRAVATEIDPDEPGADFDPDAVPTD